MPKAAASARTSLGARSFTATHEETRAGRHGFDRDLASDREW